MRSIASPVARVLDGRASVTEHTYRMLVPGPRGKTDRVWTFPVKATGGERALFLLGGPEGPEPALGEKKTPDCPTLVDGKQQSKTTKVFAQQARGSRDFFVT